MFTAQDDSQVKITRKSLALLFERLKNHKKWLLIGFLALIGVDALQIIVPKIFQHVIDSVAGGTATTTSLWIFACIIIAISIVMGFCRFCWRYFIIGASHKLERNLRQDLYDHLQKLPVQFYDHIKVGDIMAHASNDISAIRMATGIAALASFDALFLAIASVSLMISMNLQLTLISLLPLPLLTFAVLKFGRLVHKRFRQVQASFSKLSERAQESFSGMRVIKAYGDISSEKKLFSEKANDCSEQNIKLARIWSLFDPMISGLAFTSMAILIGAGGKMVIQGHLSLGEFVAFSSYLSLLLWPMMAIGWVINLLQRGTASMDRLQNIFSTIPEIRDGKNETHLEPSIEIKALTFRYPASETDVLKNISFKIPPNFTLGIAGRTGAGKTTLVELLSRLYDPPPGTIMIDSVDIHDMKLANLRNMFGYVPQETFLFAMSIADNIAFGTDGLSPAEIEDLCRVIDLHDEIINFPDGYDTMVGERGITLSGGQKQRVAIARALALNAPILVLDDALSNVDTKTEEAILSHLQERLQKSTNIIISHRISTICNSDMILVLEDSTISEMGTHEELLKRGGFYSELFHIQQLEEEAKEDQKDFLNLPPRKKGEA